MEPLFYEKLEHKGFRGASSRVIHDGSSSQDGSFGACGTLPARKTFGCKLYRRRFVGGIEVH